MKNSSKLNPNLCRVLLAPEALAPRPPHGTRRVKSLKMSFEQRHRRQQSSADSSIGRDENAPRGEDFDKTILHIQRKLDQIPRQYKETSERFNPLEQVIDMMKSSNLKERKRELDGNVKTLDKAMESIVRGM